MFADVLKRQSACLGRGRSTLQTPDTDSTLTQLTPAAGSITCVRVCAFVCTAPCVRGLYTSPTRPSTPLQVAVKSSVTGSYTQVNGCLVCSGKGLCAGVAGVYVEPEER